jgi:hypothetical protein
VQQHNRSCVAQCVWPSIRYLVHNFVAFFNRFYLWFPLPNFKWNFCLKKRRMVLPWPLMSWNTRSYKNIKLLHSFYTGTSGSGWTRTLHLGRTRQGLYHSVTTTAWPIKTLSFYIPSIPALVADGVVRQGLKNSLIKANIKLRQSPPSASGGG